MKKASVVTIIVAAVIMLAGLICCAIGSSAAKDDGFMLFPQTENGESVYTYDFTDHDINRITIDSSVSDVTLRRGGDRSYVQIRNYNANYYRLNEENRAISFAEIDDVLSMFKFWEGFSFKGMRYVFASGVDRDEAHEIIINLSDTQSVGSVVLRPKSGSINVSGFEGECDLTLSVGDGKIDASSVSVTGSFVASVTSGSLTVDGLAAQNVNLSTEECEVSVKTAKCEKFTWTGTSRTFFADGLEVTDLSATCTEASVTVTGASFQTAKIETQSGPVRIDLSQAADAYYMDIATQTGGIFLNGDKLEGASYKTAVEGETEGGADATVKAANGPEVSIRTESGAIDINTSVTETAEETQG